MRCGDLADASQNYIPDRGDLVWLRFDPVVGHEQAGYRPALVLSPLAYNTVSGLAVVCPITSQAKNYPFEVPLPDGLQITGVILTDQIKSVAWFERGMTYKDSLAFADFEKVIGKIISLLTKG
jgi:mRNA interferase MazF